MAFPSHKHITKVININLNLAYLTELKSSLYLLSYKHKNLIAFFGLN